MPQVLLSGSFDRSVVMVTVCSIPLCFALIFAPQSPSVLLNCLVACLVLQKDGRIPSHSGFRWPVDADVESLAWDPHKEHSFVVFSPAFLIRDQR